MRLWLHTGEIPNSFIPVYAIEFMYELIHAVIIVLVIWEKPYDSDSSHQIVSSIKPVALEIVHAMNIW